MHVDIKNITMEFPVARDFKRAVDDVSLQIEEGERVGIIGRNGAGKTTLLQIISGLLSPTAGDLEVRGHVNCVMTLGVGLSEEMTGRENIYLDGELNGKLRKEIDALVDSIIDFTDIGVFIDRPVRTYSTGMKARLAFALITFIEPEILIIDEALTVGDSDFSIKATKKMRELCDKGKIIILVSHSMEAIRSMCTRCIWMDNGQIVSDGLPTEVTEEYYESVRRADEEEMRERFNKRVGPRSFKDGCSIESLEFVNSGGVPHLTWRSDDELVVQFRVSSISKIKKPDFKISFERLDGNVLLENSAKYDGFISAPIQGSASYAIDFGRLDFGAQTYEVVLELYDASDDESILLASYCEVIKVDLPVGLTDSPAYFSDVFVRAEKLASN